MTIRTVPMLKLDLLGARPSYGIIFCFVLDPELEACFLKCLDRHILQLMSSQGLVPSKSHGLVVSGSIIRIDFPRRIRTTFSFTLIVVDDLQNLLCFIQTSLVSEVGHPGYRLPQKPEPIIVEVNSSIFGFSVASLSMTALSEILLSHSTLCHSPRSVTHVLRSYWS